MVPALRSSIPANACNSVDLPAPLRPRIAMRSPGWIFRSATRSAGTGASSEYWNVAWLSAYWPLITGRCTRLLPSGWSTGNSMIRFRPCSATLACCQRVSTWVIWDIGAIIRDARIDAATRLPVVMSLAMTMGAPNTTTTANTEPCTLLLQATSLLVSMRRRRLASPQVAL